MPFAASEVVSDRDAVALLVEETAPESCAVATVGMQTNLAAALERDAGLAERIPTLAVMGGLFAPVHFLGHVLPPGIDHNLNVDQRSSLRALNAGVTSLYTPVDVTMEVFLRSTHLDRLRQGDELCRVLAHLVDGFTPLLRNLAGGALPDDVVAILHDPLAVACLVDRSCVTVETLPVTVVMHDGLVRTLVDGATGHPAEIVRSVDAAAFADLWLETVLG